MDVCGPIARSRRRKHDRKKGAGAVGCHNAHLVLLGQDERVAGRAERSRWHGALILGGRGVIRAGHGRV